MQEVLRNLIEILNVAGNEQLHSRGETKVREAQGFYYEQVF